MSGISSLQGTCKTWALRDCVWGVDIVVSGWPYREEEDWRGEARRTAGAYGFPDCVFFGGRSAELSGGFRGVLFPYGSKSGKWKGRPPLAMVFRSTFAKAESSAEIEAETGGWGSTG